MVVSGERPRPRRRRVHGHRRRAAVGLAMVVPPRGACQISRVVALRRSACLPGPRLRLGGRRRIATLTRLQLGKADQRVECLEGDGELRSLQDDGALHRVTQRCDAVLHPLDGARRQQMWIDHDGDAQRV